MKTLALVLEDEARRGGGGGGYCSGDTVSGQVLLELAGPLPLRGLRLEAAGRARVAWSESPGAVPGAGTWGVAVRAPGPGPRREAEVRYLDIRQSLLRDPPEGEAGGGARARPLPQPRRGWHWGSGAAGAGKGCGKAAGSEGEAEGGTLRVETGTGTRRNGHRQDCAAAALGPGRISASPAPARLIPYVGAEKRRAGLQ